MAAGLIELAIANAERTALLSHPTLGEMLVVYQLEDGAGHFLVAENLAPVAMRIEVDASEGSRGFTSSRGMLVCQDVLPPRSRMLLMAFTLSMKAKAHALGFRFGGAAVPPGEPTTGHIPDLSGLGQLAPLHSPRPIDAKPPAALGGNVDVSALASNILGMLGQRPPQQ